MRTTPKTTDTYTGKEGILTDINQVELGDRVTQEHFEYEDSSEVIGINKNRRDKSIILFERRPSGKVIECKYHRLEEVYLIKG